MDVHLDMMYVQQHNQLSHLYYKLMFVINKLFDLHIVMEETIHQNFWWPKIMEMINEYIEKCNICQCF